MNMALNNVSTSLRTNADDLDRIDMLPMLANHLRNAADAIDAHLAQLAQSCQHDWAEGYGVPAYCNHCGKTRDSQPAQSVDVEMVREVIANLRTWHDEGTDSMADSLTAALQEKKT